MVDFCIQQPEKTPHTAAQAQLFTTLDLCGFDWQLYAHRPVFTVAEGADLVAAIAGTHTKNLFLTNKTGGIWLVVAAETTKIDLKYLSDQLQTPRFSFAKPERMLELLGVTPGSVTPLGLQHDVALVVQVVLDANMMATTHMVCHPLQNDQSLVMPTAGLLQLLQYWGYQPNIMGLG
jgi:Ala-tRNA(Pro) deacylase